MSGPCMAPLSVAVDDNGVERFRPGTILAWEFVMDYASRLYLSASEPLRTWESDHGTTVPCVGCLVRALDSYRNKAPKISDEVTADKRSISQIIQDCTFVTHDNSTRPCSARYCDPCQERPSGPFICCRLHRDILPEESNLILSAVTASSPHHALPECTRFELLLRLVERHNLLVSDELHETWVQSSVVVYKDEEETFDEQKYEA